LEKGLVIKSTGSWFTVKSENNRLINCKIKGTFRIRDLKSTNPVTVGDRVHFTVNEDGTGMIYEIDERKNYIIRRSSNLSKQYQLIAANIDQAWIIASLINPKTFLEFIDRFLVSAEAYRIPVKIIFNKIDLYNEGLLEELDEVMSLYERIGYECFKISATEKTNIEELNFLITGRINLFSGNSGVGKSTLINTIDPSLKARIGIISDFHKKGKHTTTFAQMFELSNSGYIIDTPGIKGFGVVDIDKDEIFHFFPEIFRKSSGCQFYNCMHTHEPGCAVKGAVDNDIISRSRYESYLSILKGDEGKYR
jgi:ribosome biogenesis GTPase / thiamine phosphate phosphatase